MNSRLILIAAVLASGLLSSFTGSLDAYYVQILTFIGINIILAVSLNLINGHTGQFSLGHAGFMAVGGYTAGYLTTVGTVGAGRALRRIHLVERSHPVFGRRLVRVIAAAIAGLVVGVPSLRLRGDYLAIITLGFGEIIRVMIQNIDAVGGPRGMAGIPGYTNLFWTFAIAAVTIYTISSLVDSTYGRGFHGA